MKKRCYLIIFFIAILFCQNTVYAKEYKLSKPMIGSVTASSKATIKLIWSPVKNAQKYEIYRSTKKKSGFKKIATTKKTSYIDKKGKQLHTYYYKIRGVSKNPETNTYEYSPYSIVIKKKVRKIAKKTAYAGDSLMVGLVNYGKIKENKSQKVFAKVGISTSAFYKSNLMDNLVNFSPDRLYIMLGVNDIAGNPSKKQLDTTIKYYEAILKKCIAKNPNIEIFVMGVSPVGKHSTVSMDTVNYYNWKLERRVVALENVYYYDLALDLAGEDGYLKPQYVCSDHLHWTSKTYDTVLKALKKLVKAY